MELRKDIADAVGRMRVTFGTRTAIRDLDQTLEEGEGVVDMVGCLFAAGDGLLVLTDRRVLALRDDFSAFRMKAVRLPEIKAIDYAPRVHDGLGILTAAGRIAVRRMNRQDADRLVDGIFLRVPDAILGVSRPSNVGGKPVFEADSPGRRGAAAVTSTMTHEDIPDTPSTRSAAAEPTHRVAKVSATDGQVVDSAAADEAVLVGVLADLHAKGLLTEEELAVKIAQLTRRS